MKKTVLLAMLISISFLRANAANNRYFFQTGSATYTELTGDSDITADVYATYGIVVTELMGKTFNFFGEPWPLDTTTRYFGITSQGRVLLGVPDDGIALYDALYSDTLKIIDNTSKVSYKIEGSGSSTVVKVQWKNLKVFTGPAGNYINFQMWLYQDGTVEYHYGPRSANNASGYTNPVTAIYIGIWYSNEDFTSIYEKIQVSGTPPNIILDSVLNTNVPHVQGVPENGTVYKFIPKSSASAV